MKLLILFLSLFLFIIPSIHSFECSDCDQWNCHRWPSCLYLLDKKLCVENFPDQYPNETTFYIDSVNGSDVHSEFGGNITSPFKTLEYAVKALRGRDGAILMMDRYDRQTIKIKSQIVINSSVILTSLSQDMWGSWKFISLDLQGFNVSWNSAFKIQQGGNLTIIRAKFRAIATIKDLDTVFDIEDGGQLNFHSVHFYDTHIPAKIVRSTGPSSSFNYDFGTHWNSSFTFDLQGGRHVIFKLRFIEINTTRAVFTLNQTSLAINDTTVRNGDDLFIHMENESVLQVQNLTFSSYNGSFLYARDPSFISVNYSDFRDVKLKSPVPFIHITGSKIQAQFAHFIKGSRFWDMKLKSSLIFIDKPMASITLDDVDMLGIQQGNREYSRGACLAAENEVSVSIEKSIFRGINTTCIDLDSSALQLENNVFDNKWGEGLERQASDSRGITWVSLNGGTNSVGPGFLVKILSNDFRENRLAPLNGGALRFTGNFPGTVIIKNNSFTGNKAIASGGAIYSDNVNQKFEIQDSKFAENFAHIAAAIHILNNSTNLGQHEWQVKLKDVKFIKNKSYQGHVVVVAEAERFIEENCLYEDNQELRYVNQKKISSDDL